MAKNNNDGRFFACAPVYLPKAMPLTELPDARKTICIALYGEGEDFFTLKGVVEGLLDALKCDVEPAYVKSEKTYMHPTRAAELVLSGKNAGCFGELNPILAEKLGIDKRVYVAELDFGVIAQSVNDKTSFKAIAKYPSVERDLALLADVELTNAQIIECIKTSNVKNMESVEIFDVYTGANLPAGKKSMAYRIKFTALDRTLSVEDVEKYVNKILRNLKERLNIEIR